MPHMPVPRRPRRAVLTGLAGAVVLLLTAGVTAAVALAGGGEDPATGPDASAAVAPADAGPAPAEDLTPTTIPEGYFGAWQGEYGTEGEPGWRGLWFEILGQGEPGDTVGTATITFMDTMCVYDIRLSAAHEDRLVYTEATTDAVPAAELPEKCRAQRATQELWLHDTGEMRWVNGDVEATLERAGDAGQELVPASLVRSWHDEFRSDGEPNVDDVTIEQAAVGDTVMRWTWTAPGVRCVTENRLAMVDGDRILLSPETLVSERGDADCLLPTQWAWVDDGTLYLLEINDPNSDPYPIEND
jgi:hypothetical protein